MALFHRKWFDLLENDEEKINHLKQKLEHLELSKKRLTGFLKGASERQKREIAARIADLCADAEHMLEALKKVEHHEKATLRQALREFKD